MEKRFDVVLISAFGRGHWLSQQMIRLGLKVAMVDVTDQLGSWTVEDWEGPFGLFSSPGFSALQRARLEEDADLEELPQGMALWLGDGPIEMRGPLTDFSLSNRGVSSAAVDYIRGFETDPPEVIHARRGFLLNGSFQQSWLAHIAHQMAANIFTENIRSMERGIPLPLFSPFSLRRLAAKGIVYGFETCVKSGVDVLGNGRVMDISIQERVVDCVEVWSHRSGVIKGRKFIWLLSGDETRKLPERVLRTLYPRGVVEPQWTWVRFRLSWSEGPEMDALPHHFVMISDIHLPWTHSNLCIAVRAIQGPAYDLWVRISSIKRADHNYLHDMGEELKAEFRRRIPSADSGVLEMPSEYRHGGEDSSAVKFPVYDAADLRRIHRLELKNLSYDGAEDWNGLDWRGQHWRHNSLLRETWDWFENRHKRGGHDRSV